jgi:hypothetical protein
METLFHSQRMTLSNSQNFLRTNFRGGATRLTMLSSHHWPGMMFAFLLLLLTPTGAEICCSCFLDEDVEEPDYDWDSAPGFDLDNVYKPPILCQHVNHGNDIHHTLTRNSDDKVQDIPLESVYSGVISLRGLPIIIFLLELNGLDLWATDIGNA